MTQCQAVTETKHKFPLLNTVTSTYVKQWPVVWKDIC